MNYHLSTKKGTSGAPIVSVDSKGRILVIGVHSGFKKGDNYFNHGLFFQKQTIALLKKKIVELKGIQFTS